MQTAALSESLRCAPQNQTAAIQGVLPRKSRYASLDAWRGLACLFMVVFHTTMQVSRSGPSEPGILGELGSLMISATTKLRIGVPIFFVISGYCIMATLDARRNKPSAVGEYIKRRFWRIYPTYWAGLAISVIAIGSIEYGFPGLLSDGKFEVPALHSLSGWQWFGNLTLTESWRHCFAGDGSLHILPNTWTLCYEEQFYAVAGVILLLAPRRIFGAAAAVTVLAVLAKLAADHANVAVKGTFLDGRWLLIASGILVYYRINYAPLKAVRWIHALLACGILVAAWDAGMLLGFEPAHRTERLAAFSFALLISLIYPWDAWISNLRILAPLNACGKMSYSIYLVHGVVIKAISRGLYHAGFRENWETLALTVPLCLLISIALAACFYQLVERRFLNNSVKGRARRDEASPTAPSRQESLLRPSLALNC